MNEINYSCVDGGNVGEAARNILFSLQIFLQKKKKKKEKWKRRDRKTLQ